MRVRVDLNISLDGFATSEGSTPESPMGPDWERLTGAYVATRTFRRRVFGDESGAGTVGVDDAYAARYFEGIGAEVMGAGMFGLHHFPDDPEWRGWWGDAPPFHYPVIVLTHRRTGDLDFSDGTSFHFRDLSARDALDVARDLAKGADVRVGGGPSTVRQFLLEGLVDSLHVAIAPIILGRGVNLWSGLRDVTRDFTVHSEVAESGTVHVTWSRDSIL